MKCPRCKKEVDPLSNYCPYCGQKLDKKSNLKPSRNNNIILFIVVAICVALISYNFVSGLTAGYTLANTTTSSTGELGSIEGSSTTVVATYNSIDAFNDAYTNASTYSKKVTTYNKKLAKQLGNAVSTNCKVEVYDNNNVCFTVNNTYSKESMTIKVQRIFDREESQDKYEYQFITDASDTFDGLVLSDAQKSLISNYVSSTDLNNIESSLYKRKDEFENKKKHLGHYGMGEYLTNISDVIKKQNNQYYKVFTVYR